MSLRVIGAGFGRTGTKSLKVAVEKLGFGKCYHMEDVGQNASHGAVWIDAALGKPVDWDALFKGYQAAVDLPPCAFYSELMTHYADAKVILTTREPEQWYDSAAKTILRLPPRPVMSLLRVASLFNKNLKMLINIEPVARKVGYEYLFGDDLSKENVIRTFKRHNATVKQVVPPEKLLIYEVTQGWRPLCEFLGMPVPDEPFPHTNTRQEFQKANSL